MASGDLPMPKPTVPNKSFTSFKSLSFDIYGTLIDWETSIVQLLDSLLKELPDHNNYKHAATDARSRIKLAELFNKHEHDLQSEQPEMKYDHLLTAVYERIAADLGLQADEKYAKAFGNSVGEWIPFPDTVDAMKRLGKFYKLVPLSNVDRESFQRTLNGPLAGVNFWRIYVAQDIGSYKPDLRNFEYLLKHLDEDDKSEGGSGISKEQDLMVAQSLFHDHVPAKMIGLASVWINRKGAGMGSGSGVRNLHESGEVGYGWRFNTLGEFADEVERQWAGQS